VARHRLLGRDLPKETAEKYDGIKSGYHHGRWNFKTFLELRNIMRENWNLSTSDVVETMMDDVLRCM